MIPEGEATAEELGEIAATNIPTTLPLASEGVEGQIDQAQERLDHADARMEQRSG
jgi:hypothetical protein